MKHLHYLEIRNFKQFGYAPRTCSQLIIVTHSEVILRESLDHNLTLLLDGRADDLASKSDYHQRVDALWG